MMQKVIHITDIHMTAPPNLVVGLDPKSRFDDLVEKINTDHADAALCVISGDLTDQGDPSSYERLKASLDQLRLPYALTLGNHDNRKAFLQSAVRSHSDVEGFALETVDLGDARIVLLDTLDDARPDTGRLCQRRLDWFDSALGEAGDQPVVLFMHHPPRSIGTACFDAMMLNDPEPFWRIVKQHQNLRHIAFGHTHLNVTGCWGRISFSCNAGPCHHIALDLDNPVVTFVESLPRFDVLLLDGSDVVVHQVSLVPDALRLAREFPTPDGLGRFEYFNKPVRSGRHGA